MTEGPVREGYPSLARALLIAVAFFTAMDIYVISLLIEPVKQKLGLFGDESGALTLPPILSFMRQSLEIEDTQVRLTEFGNEDVRTAVAFASGASIDGRQGRYGSDATDATLDIRTHENAGRLIASGSHGSVEYKLEPITTTVWRATPLAPFVALGAIVTFHSDASLTLTAGRMLHVRFRRHDRR